MKMFALQVFILVMIVMTVWFLGRKTRASGMPAKPNNMTVSMKQYWEIFLTRARSEPIDEESICSVAESLRRLLEYPATDTRLLAAESLIFNLAYPGKIAQGHHGTCGPASIEYIVMKKAPHIGAAIVVAAALDGCWVDEDGKVARISPDDLIPGAEEVKFPSAKPADRNFASQLFQNLAMNNSGAYFLPPQRFEARQGLGTEVWVDEEGKVTPYNDPGTGIIDRTGGFTSWEAGGLLHRLMGDRFANGVLNSSKYTYTYIPTGDVPPGSDGDIAYFSTLEELSTSLKAHEDIPVLANINMSSLYTGKRDPNQPLPDHFIAVKLRSDGLVECYDAKKLVSADDRGLWQLTVERLYDALN